MACGKGHEQSMCFGETEYPWDDRTAMRAALAEKMKLQGRKCHGCPPRKRKTGELKSTGFEFKLPI